MITPGPWFAPNPQWFAIRSCATNDWIPATSDNVRMMAAAPELRSAVERLLAGEAGAREDAIALLESLPE